MKLIKKIILSLLVLTFTFGSFTGYANENNNTKVEEKANKNEKKNLGKWVTNDRGRFYYVGENYAIYWHKIDDEWYYFGEDGKMAVGWQEIPSKHIVGKFSGDNVKELEVQSKWHYFDENGILTDDGWRFLPKKDINVNRRFGDPTKEIEIQKKWFYFDYDGAIKTGWIKDNNTWYYLSTNEKIMGEMQIGWIKDENTWYYLNYYGAMQTGWIKDGNTWYYLNYYGAMQTGWIKDGNTWYYLNYYGAMQTGWIKDGNTWYYLKKSGAMVTGEHKINGKYYYFDNSGRLM